ncbi:ATP-binding cassette domain-containing protein [Egibacter rhizosphaerae]|uniref:ATP-binding cassette domain-containing protein n=1 Tax=Egibacter rhizosphaerae TaxID=1670831 RepID=A0A411YF14_9ACTN|nr:ATP-binding cassette domain-containing protein [Egibacter rhizosphaerae]QBI19786.1 ATP-binding cassette domain-containing protein [Egibacter rhizosphaerae]
MLSVSEVTVDFTGLRAVDHVSFEVAEGEILGLIGPNGAGKTTTFNVVSGLVRPTSGVITFRGEDIARLGPADRSRRGIGRTFQIVKPFGNLSVLDNVVVAALTRGQRVPTARDVAGDALRTLGLEEFAHSYARGLPLALRKRLELARALATDARLLLLDEIMGGLTPTEVNGTLDILRRLNGEGLTFLIIEHNMKAIMQLADRIVVLNHGAKLAEGTPRRSPTTRTSSPPTWASRRRTRPTAETPMALLEVQDIAVHYGDMCALSSVSLAVEEGEAVAVLGANAAGKTTLLRAISGLVPVTAGAIRFDGDDITADPPHERVERGLVQVPEGRMVFPFLSVLDNLRLGAHAARARDGEAETLELALELFPRLRERREQMAGSLSGGEQQMLALARALMTRPRLLMLDEPSLGLAPLLVREVMERVQDIHREGVTVLMVEQNVAQTLKLVDRGSVLENGVVAMSGSAEELSASDEVRRAYLGI